MSINKWIYSTKKKTTPILLPVLLIAEPSCWSADCPCVSCPERWCTNLSFSPLKDLQQGLRSSRPEGGPGSRWAGSAGSHAPGAALEAALPDLHEAPSPPAPVVHRPQPPQVNPQVRRGRVDRTQLTGVGSDATDCDWGFWRVVLTSVDLCSDLLTTTKLLWRPSSVTAALLWRVCEWRRGRSKHTDAPPSEMKSQHWVWQS